MKLRNKKTGEIAIFRSIPKWDDKSITLIVEETKRVYQYDTLAGLCEEWTDYEAPKKFWCIIDNGNIAVSNDTDEDLEASKEIGNYFETKEEAEKAVRKLKAWKRLRDAGFKFKFYFHHPFLGENIIEYKLLNADKYVDDLDLLFSGGEE